MGNKHKFLGWIFLAVVSMGWGGSRALAKDEPPDDASARKPQVTPQVTTHTAFLAGPSLYETGRVGAMTVSDPTAASQLDHQVGTMPKEQAVEPVTPDPNRASVATQSGYLNGSVLAMEIRDQVSALSECRVQQARSEGRPWNEIAGGRVNLRWIIRANGTVAEAEAVAVDPIDLRLLDCVKQQVGAWKFARPSGGTLPVTYSYSFK